MGETPRMLDPVGEMHRMFTHSWGLGLGKTDHYSQRYGLLKKLFAGDSFFFLVVLRSVRILCSRLGMCIQMTDLTIKV